MLRLPSYILQNRKAEILDFQVKPVVYLLGVYLSISFKIHILEIFTPLPFNISKFIVLVHNRSDSEVLETVLETIRRHLVSFTT